MGRASRQDAARVNEPKSRYEDTRSAGRAILLEHLGLEDTDTPRLLDLARESLGRSRAQRCVDLARRSPLTQRYQGISAIAALIVGTHSLGVEWWDRPHRPAVTSADAEPGPTPAQHLAEEHGADETWPPRLVELGWWIADDVAIDQWGPLIEEVDLNNPRGVDRVAVPAGARVGQRFAAHFDAGGIVEIVVELRDGGTLGTRLGETQHSIPAEVRWAWGVACRPPGPFPLPGDSPDPYSEAVDPRLVNELRDQAVSFGWGVDRLGPVWQTRGDLCVALAKLDWPWLDGDGKTLEWRKRMDRTIDGE